MSYRPMVKVGGEWCGNGLRFATEEEALANARDLMSRWMLVDDVRVDQSDEPAKDAWINGRLVFEGAQHGHPHLSD